VAALESSTGAQLGVAWLAAGGEAAGVASAGSWSTGHAWSTVKVPIAIAALDAHGASADAAAGLAITQSDNAAAGQLWDLLGADRPAADATEAVLRAGGDLATAVQPAKTRPEFSAFGQTLWDLRAQAGFAAQFPAGESADRVWELMGQIDSSQRWGLGRFDGAHFKGGWGPDDSGYVVRQFGQVPVGGGCTAIAVGAWAPTFAAGTRALDQLADTLAALSAQFPTGTCR
jgi:hypothetical protein